MNRYITVKKDTGELICSIDTKTGECLASNGVEIETDDFEEVFQEKDGKFFHLYNDR